MVELALARYLRSKPEVTDYVGQRISLERRHGEAIVSPPEVGNLAITVGRISATREYALRGEADSPDILLRLNIYAKGGAAVSQLFELFEQVRQLTSGWRGSWDETTILGCTWESEGTEAEAPTDASDYWDFSYGTDMRIHYLQDKSPIYTAC